VAVGVEAGCSLVLEVDDLGVLVVDGVGSSSGVLEVDGVGASLGVVCVPEGVLWELRPPFNTGLFSGEAGSDEGLGSSLIVDEGTTPLPLGSQ
jgi:hypothetical protein